MLLWFATFASVGVLVLQAEYSFILGNLREW
jgi:hypothetical protein